MAGYAWMLTTAAGNIWFLVIAVTFGVIYRGFFVYVVGEFGRMAWLGWWEYYGAGLGGDGHGQGQVGGLVVKNKRGTVVLGWLECRH